MYDVIVQLIGFIAIFVNIISVQFNTYKKIIAFQERKGLPSFIEAVRQLCNDALNNNINVKINLK